MTRAREDAAFEADCKALISRRADTVIERYRRDLDEARVAHSKAQELKEDAECDHLVAAGKSNSLRHILYRLVGWRGPRPPALVRADTRECEARNHLRRCGNVLNKAESLLASAAALAARAKNLDPTFEVS